MTIRPISLSSIWDSLKLEFRLSQASDGIIEKLLLEALHANHECPDFILLVLKMPRVSGFDILEYIRERGICQQARIIIMTSSANPGDRDWSLTLGAERFVSKPTMFEDLLVLLKDLADPPSESTTSPESTP